MTRLIAAKVSLYCVSISSRTKYSKSLKLGHHSRSRTQSKVICRNVNDISYERFWAINRVYIYTVDSLISSSKLSLLVRQTYVLSADIHFIDHFSSW